MYTVSDVLDKIIADLKEASKLLENDPIKTGSTTTDFIGTRKWHLNYYAVRALMARVYMYKNDKENALACAKEVIDSEKFPWVSNDKVTTTSRDTRDGLFKSECIFMLNNRSLKTLTEKYMKEGTSYGSGNILHVSPEVKDDILKQLLMEDTTGATITILSSWTETIMEAQSCGRVLIMNTTTSSLWLE